MTGKHTPLHALHAELGARMVTFAGYELPVSYASGIVREHEHTRERASLFDVSHMGQILVTGEDAAAALEALMPTDLVNLGEGRQRYAMLTSEAGGVLDDLMVARLDEGFLLVVNAARKADDLARIEAHVQEIGYDDCRVQMLSDRALLALQGPKAADVLEPLAPDAASLRFMDVRRVVFTGTECIVSRAGYTGEDGFEVSVPASEAEALARALLAHPEVAPAGLGARDTLRLEAGLCLYGNELDETTTPFEAGLGWVVKLEKGEFLGRAALLAVKAAGVKRKLAGFEMTGRGIARHGYPLLDVQGNPVGVCTSGSPSPTLGTNIGLGYLPPALAAVGIEILVDCRGKHVPARVVATPFYRRRE